MESLGLIQLFTHIRQRSLSGRPKSTNIKSQKHKKVKIIQIIPGGIDFMCMIHK